MIKFEVKDIKKLGWKLKRTSESGDTYNWDTNWNSPELHLWNDDGVMKCEIQKFAGMNSWYGKYGIVFRGNCPDIKTLKLICKLVELDNYWKGEF